SGWGFIIGADNNYQILYGGSTVLEGSPASPGIWTHLAFVRTNSVTVFFVNGVPVSSTNLGPKTPTAGFCVGAPPQSPTNQFFTGLIDEVRVFTFTAGQFSASDLLVSGGKPRVTATTASPLTTTSSLLNGNVLPNGVPTRAWFNWGATTNYGQVTT